jgi:cold shock CspA family protein
MLKIFLVSCFSLVEDRGFRRMEATVKDFFPETSSGFLENPDGGKDILFRKEWFQQDAASQSFPVPERGDVVKILKLNDKGKGPRATRWKLLQRSN